MIFLPVVPDTGFPTGKATSTTSQVSVDLIIGDELTDKGRIHHVGLILPERGMQFVQTLSDLVELMIAETKILGILCKGFSELCVLLNQNGMELRVVQLISQIRCFIGESTELALIENCQIVSFLGFATQVTIEIPQRFSQFLSLIARCFHQFHIGSELTVFKQFSNTGCCILPRNNLRSGTVDGRGTFGKVNAILGIPRRNISAILFDTKTAVIDHFQSLGDFFHRLLFHILQSYNFSGFIGITAKQ